MSNETLQFILSALALIGVIFTIYKYFREPDIKLDKDVALIKQSCSSKHSNLDEKIGAINENIGKLNKTLLLLQENDIKHIELRVGDIEKGQIRMDEKLGFILEALRKNNLNERL